MEFWREPSGGSGHEPEQSAPLGGTRTLDDLVALDPASLTDTELCDASRRLAVASGRVDAAQCRIAEAMHARQAHARDGARTVGAWLAARSQLSRTRCRDLTNLRHDLRDCPATSAAHADGRLSTVTVQAMMRSRLDVEDLYTRDETVLVAGLAPLTALQAQIALRRWSELALAELDTSPDDPHPDDPALNSLQLRTTFDGHRTLDGTYAPIVGAELTGLIENEVTRLFSTGRFAADDGLTPQQRNATALLELARRGALVETEAGEPHRAVNILVDLNRILGLTAETPEELLAWPCELADGSTVALAQVLDLLADATLTTVLGLRPGDGRFRPIGEITTNRTANATQRRLLRCRDQGCAWPGCDQPARWTQAHHEPPWDDTHHTTVLELALLCRHHHHCRHDQGFTLRVEPDGTVTVHRPDGTPLPHTPHGHQVPTAPDPPGHDPPDPPGPPGPPSTRRPDPPPARRQDE
jgi:hypothetical protein